MKRRLIDSNILVYALDSKSSFHKTSLEIIYDENRNCITHQNLLETYRATTRDEIIVKTFSPIKIKERLDLFADAFVLLPTRNTTYEVLGGLISKYEITSYQVYDANLVAHMIENDISVIYTNNHKDFAKYDEITAVNPFIV